MEGHHVGVWVPRQLGFCRGCGGEDDAGPARDLWHVRLYVTPRGSLRSWGHGGVAAAVGAILFSGVIPLPAEDAPGIQWSLGNGDVTSQDTYTKKLPYKLLARCVASTENTL